MTIGPAPWWYELAYKLGGLRLADVAVRVVTAWRKLRRAVLGKPEL